MINPQSVFLILSLAFTTSALSQKKYCMGIEGGPSTTFLTGSKIDKRKYSSIFSSSAGLFFQYNLSKIIAIRIAVGIEKKGTNYAYSYVSLGGYLPYYVKDNHKVNFDYLTFPILFKRTFTGKINCFFNVGPFLGYLIRQPVGKIVEGGGVYYNNHYSQFDGGISGGFGISIPIKNKFSVSSECRYNLGIVDITAMGEGHYGTIYTQSINFLFGFSYHFGALPDN
ncbi:MAG TPA: outer membrane beta-barrel protein [Bacteroidia bacterium]|nr:outer membrane beta-barrel protein [Bacteroidia bacterium]